VATIRLESSENCAFSCPLALTAIHRTTSSCGVSCSCFSAHHNPFSATKLHSCFTANLTLGKSWKPIPVPGGILINALITGGTVSGPTINGTIECELSETRAHGPLFRNSLFPQSLLILFVVGGALIAMVIPCCSFRHHTSATWLMILVRSKLVTFRVLQEAFKDTCFEEIWLVYLTR
jgi:hypothetical protein